MLEDVNMFEFEPTHTMPIIVQFIDFLHERGYSTKIDFDSWDFLVYDKDDEPFLAIISVKNKLPKKLHRTILATQIPYKIIFVEGNLPDMISLGASRLLLQHTGTGIFVRDVGWVALPYIHKTFEIEDLNLKLARKWHKDENGVWKKKCSRCKKEKGIEHYYKQSNPNLTDPYRPWCKECMKEYDKQRFQRRRK